MAVVSGALAVLSAASLVTPATLITITLLLGICQALTSPGWQAIQPELVPRAQLPAAAALGSLNVNVARAIGPALAGLVLAVSSPAVVFGIDAISDLAVVGAVLAWKRQANAPAAAEPMAPALRAGVRYVRNAPGIRRILVRAALFVLPASALWGLLPVVASKRLGLGSGGYGLLLGALGVGAVVGALLIKTLRAHLGRNTLLGAATVAYAVGGLACATLHHWGAVAALLLLAGVGWLVSLSTLNTTLQLALPTWVRARGLAVYLMVFMGGQGVGALVWGLIAGAIGTVDTLLAASALLLVGVALLPVVPIRALTGTLERTVVSPWMEPEIGAVAGHHEEPDPAAGPVLVEVSYRAAPENSAQLLEALHALGTSRRRTGAARWAVYRDVADLERYLEVFEVPSWGEHQRQHHERTTGYDADLYRRAAALAAEPPRARHLLPPLHDQR
ncbi:MFS transporter, partial [Actinospica robiniae]|uniref:MFS transporter n=1 Tax=Actinospica robiniae TaxID=304901 RepID=UPI000416351A